MSLFSLEFWRDLTVQTFSAVAGFATAVLIYQRGIRHAREKEKKDNDEKELNKLKYFLLLIKSVIALAKEQSEGYKIYAEKIKGDPLKHHLLPLTVSHDLKRVSEKINVEEYYLSYLNQLKRSDQSIINFRDIISTSNFVDTLYDEVLKTTKGRLETLFQKKIQFQAAFQEIQDLSIALFNLSDIGNTSVVIAFKAIYEGLHKIKKSEADLEAAIEHFVKPLIELIYKNKIQHFHEGRILYFKLKDIYIIYNRMLFDASGLQKMHEEFEIQMKQAYEKLKTAIKELEDYLSTKDFKIPEKIEIISK